MAIYTFPAITPKVFELHLDDIGPAFESPETGSEQTTDTGPAKWFGSMTFRVMGSNRGQMWGFLSRLRRRHRFTKAVQNPPQRGILTGTPLVNGAPPSSNTINIDGWTPSQTGIMLVGDFFSIGNRLYQCVLDANSGGGAGNALITFEPELREIPSDGAAVEVLAPIGKFMFEAVPEFPSRGGKAITDLVLEFKEDIL